MLVYIKGQTMVKGIQNSNVYYLGTVQDDGYIYFNDQMFYRVPTPDMSQTGVEIYLSGVQLWYTVRNCWINSDRFTNLNATVIDLEQIQSLADDLDTLNRRVNTVISDINNLGHMSLGTMPGYGYGNGGSLVYLLNKVSEIASWCNSQGAGINVDSRTIWTGWNDIS